MIPAERAHLHIAANTNPGRLGKVNEDRFAVASFRLSAEDSTPAVFAIVSDGVGGHRAGEIAAQMTVELVSKAIAESHTANQVDVLKNAIIKASSEIKQHAKENPDLAGMAATCVCAWVVENQLYCASAGDSRMYLMRSKHIHQLTKDHTWVQEAIERGVLSDEQARNHPNLHVIRRYLGSTRQIDPDTDIHIGALFNDAQRTERGALLLNDGDILLLCTDGLTDLVEATEILQAFRRYPLQDSVNYLIDLSNQRGGHDNITLVALSYPGRHHPAPTRRRDVLYVLLLVALLLAAISTICAFTGLLLILQRLAS